MIHLGDMVRRKIAIFDPERPRGNPEKKTVEATVVYIHPERRYDTLEYHCAGGTYRESEYFT